MNIKELAEQAGLAYKTQDGHYWMDAGYVDIHLERFAELVAEQMHTNNKAKWYQEGYDASQRDEREACAKLCDESERVNLYGVKECAAAIRARGDKHD